MHVGHAHRRRQMRLHHRLRLIRLHWMLWWSRSWSTWRCRSGCRRAIPARSDTHRRCNSLRCCTINNGQLWRRTLVSVPRSYIHVVFAWYYRTRRHTRTLLFQSLILYGQLGFRRLAGNTRPSCFFGLAEWFFRRFR